MFKDEASSEQSLPVPLNPCIFPIKPLPIYLIKYF